MATLRYARLLVHGAARDAVEDALAAVLARDGYVPFDDGRIPPSYPAEAGEFDRWLVGGPEGPAEVVLVAEDVRRAFARASGLAAALPGALLVALVRPPAQPLRVKAYRDGTLALKVGEDPDDELFYSPRVSEPAAVAAFLHDWGVPRSPPDASPEALARALVPGRHDLAFAEACAAGSPGLPALRVFVSSRSRLFRESD